MSTTSSTEPKRSGGIGKGILITLVIIILVILTFAIAMVILTGPGKAQLRRLEASRTDELAALPMPESTGGGTVLEIPEEMLSQMLSMGPEAAFAHRPEVNYLGLDLRLDDQEINLLSGVEGKVPGVGWRRAAVMEFRAETGVTDEGLIYLTPKSIRFGRFPLPIGLLFKLPGRIPNFPSVEKDMADSGVHIDTDSGRILIDPRPWLSGQFPGMEIKQIRAVRGALRIAVGMPQGFDKALTDVILAAGRNEQDLMRRLNDVVPPEQQAILTSIGALFDAARNHEADEKTETMSASVSYTMGQVDAQTPGSTDALPVDFGDRLPMGSTVSCGKDSYAELSLPGEHIVKIGEQSKLVILTINNVEIEETSLSLLKGKVRVLVSALQDNENFELTTTDAVMAVRGTDFVAQLQRNGTVEMAVLEGRVSVNDEITVEADQSVLVENGQVGNLMPISPEFIADIRDNLGIRTLPQDWESLNKVSIASVAMPHIMEAAEVWVELDEKTQWDIQYAIEEYMKENPEIGRSIDEFFRVNGWEDQRREFEEMFE